METHDTEHWCYSTKQICPWHSFTPIQRGSADEIAAKLNAALQRKTAEAEETNSNSNPLFAQHHPAPAPPSGAIPADAQYAVEQRVQMKEQSAGV